MNEKVKFQRDKKRRKVHFQPGDLVWIHMSKERFPTKRRSKISPRSDGPFEIIEKVNENAYKVDLRGEHGVSSTFNVADLSPYYDADEEIPSLRTNFSEKEEDVVNQPKDYKLIADVSKAVVDMCSHVGADVYNPADVDNPGPSYGVHRVVTLVVNDKLII